MSTDGTGAGTGRISRNEPSHQGVHKDGNDHCGKNHSESGVGISSSIHVRTRTASWCCCYPHGQKDLKLISQSVLIFCDVCVQDFSEFEESGEIDPKSKMMVRFQIPDSVHVH